MFTFIYNILTFGGNFMIACTWNEYPALVLLQSQFKNEFYFDPIPHVFVHDSDKNAYACNIICAVVIIYMIWQGIKTAFF